MRDMVRNDKPVWRDVAREDAGGDPGVTSLRAGLLIDISLVRHRVLAIVLDRVLALDVQVHVPYLVQEADGSIQPPTIVAVEDMLESGTASLVSDEDGLASPTDRIGCAIDMLDAGGVCQGDKAIWLYLSTHWTAAHHARFGPFDPPWKIRRWRAALRRSRRERDASVAR